MNKPIKPILQLIMCALPALAGCRMGSSLNENDLVAAFNNIEIVEEQIKLHKTEISTAMSCAEDNFFYYGKTNLYDSVYRSISKVDSLYKGFANMLHMLREEVFQKEGWEYLGSFPPDGFKNISFSPEMEKKLERLAHYYDVMDSMVELPARDGALYKVKNIVIWRLASVLLESSVGEAVTGKLFCFNELSRGYTDNPLITLVPTRDSVGRVLANQFNFMMFQHDDYVHDLTVNGKEVLYQRETKTYEIMLDIPQNKNIKFLPLDIRIKEEGSILKFTDTIRIVR